MRARNKFGAIKTKYKGNIYDSKSEANYAEILDGMLARNEIAGIKRQVVFPLPDRKGARRLRYIADFVVTRNDGSSVVIDVKGVLTPANNVKLAYVRYVHSIDVELVFTTGPEKFRTDFLLVQGRA